MFLWCILTSKLCHQGYKVLLMIFSQSATRIENVSLLELNCYPRIQILLKTYIHLSVIEPPCSNFNSNITHYHKRLIQYIDLLINQLTAYIWSIDLYIIMFNVSKYILYMSQPYKVLYTSQKIKFRVPTPQQIG